MHVQWLAGNGESVAKLTYAGINALAAATSRGHDGIATFLTATSSWSAFKILVACRLADDAKRFYLLCSSCLDPCTGPTSLAASAIPKDALCAGSPDVCPATRHLVHAAMAPWAPSRHFLFHTGVRTHIRMVLLSGNRVRDRQHVPTELWRLICSFFLRSDWDAPVAWPLCSVRLLAQAQAA